MESDIKEIKVLRAQLKEIVWYGSMNLLSKDDVEDNIMRVVSKQIAAELLEMTFKRGNQLQHYELPLPR